jgi:hypothetical protein
MEAWATALERLFLITATNSLTALANADRIDSAFT